MLDDEGRHYWVFKYRPYWIIDINTRGDNPNVSYVVSNDENVEYSEQVHSQRTVWWDNRIR